jgi:hypothetical protein
MLRILTASSLIALAAIPAIAQQADPMASPTPMDAPETVEAQPRAEPAPTPAPAAAPQSRELQVTQLVEAEFPAYDADKSGDLEEPEFTKWLLALHAAGGDAKSAAMDQNAKLKWAKDGFAAADADKSKKISKAEMSKFLLG